MTTTPKLGLYLPQGGDLGRDINKSHNDQMKLIDNNFKVEVAPNKAAFPLVPYDGQLAYAEDIAELYYWNALNVAWVYILGRKNAWGRKQYVKSAVQGETVGQNQEKGPYLSATYNQIKDRIYKVTWNAECDSPQAGNFGNNQLRIRYKLAGTVSVVDELLYWMWVDHMNGGQTQSVGHSGSFSYTAESTSQITLGTFLSRGTGTQSLFFAPGQDNNLIIEDVGWNG